MAKGDKHRSMAEADRLFSVATLVATVMYAARLTFPGGDNGPNQGTAFLLTRESSDLQAFFLTDIRGMISSGYAAFLFLYCNRKGFIVIRHLIMIAAGVMLLAFVSGQHYASSYSPALLLSPFVMGCFVEIYSLIGMEERDGAATRFFETLREDIWAWISNPDQHVFDVNTISENEELGNAPSDEEAVKKTQDLIALHEGECNTTADIVHKPPTPLCRCFTFAEIQLATHDFDNAFVIGKGGFGKVYKGSMHNEAATVAIKRLDPLSKQGSKEFWTEIHMLSQFRHTHLVSLIGYCNEPNEMILVYEYMSKGSLADYLHIKEGRNVNTCTLCWVQRLKICIGAARGLDYLHTGTSFSERVIHRDVKTSNILLDANWAAKISDFGLSKIGPANQSCTHVTTCVMGTRGYIDPDYLLTHRLTRKSDVYAFGVVLFEVLSGRHAMDSRLPVEQRGLAVWAQHCIREDKAHILIDPNLNWEIFPDSLKEFVKIAEQCLHSCPKKRPKMSKVVTSLESALAFQERKDSSLLGDYDFDFDSGGT